MKSLVYLIGGFILILVVVSILGPVAAAVNASTLTGFPRTILNMIPTFIALGGMGIALALVMWQLKESGLME